MLATLKDLVSDPSYGTGVMRVIEQAATAADPIEVLEVLHAAKSALGVEHAVFVSFVRDEDSHESYRFLLAADARWCLEYQASAWYGTDPWLLYSARNSEPISSSQIRTMTKQQREVQELAKKYGMVSVCIAPAASPGGISRVGMLALGSTQPGFFESEGFVIFRALARSIAMEFHEWWVRHARKELIESCRITDEDRQLLRYELDGIRTKQIAHELGISEASVDSRWQRLNRKFGAPNRQVSARIAVQHGVI